MTGLRPASYKIALWNCKEWIPVIGYEGLYEIHWRGAVRNAANKILLVPGLSGRSYLSIMLYKDRVGKTHHVHRLIASNFLINAENKRCVNHDDGIKTNNHLSNIGWATYGENNSHAIRTGLRKVKVTTETINKVLSLHVKADPVFGAQGLAKILNLEKSTIHQILNKYKYGKV